MANYHQTGFTTLQELAKEKQVEKAKEELSKFVQVKEKEKEKSKIERMIEAFSDCD